MLFDDIIGQKFAKKYMINSLRNDKIGHAYIFEGIEGVGKSFFAKELAKELLGSKNLYNSTDFYEIKPEGNSIKISQIRQLQSDIVIKPHSNYKIYLIDESEKLTVQSQNALLKTLEEPPSYAIIILICSNKESILDTIKSRCEKIKFYPISNDDMKKFCMINGISESSLNFIYSFAKGSIKRALDISNSEKFISMRDDAEKYIEILTEKDLSSYIDLIDDIEKYKDDIMLFLEIFTSYFKDIMIFVEGLGDENLINVDKDIFIENISKRISSYDLVKIIGIIDYVINNLKSNCNFSINMQVLFLNIYEVIV